MFGHNLPADRAREMFKPSKNVEKVLGVQPPGQLPRRTVVPSSGVARLSAALSTPQI